MNLDGLKYLIVGSGFWGSVIAERIASVFNEKVLVIDKRNHIGGNSYSRIDSNTGIECHCYGTHVFHTSNRKVWDYINKFSDFTSYQHKVYTTCMGKVYSMPINLDLINSYFGINLKPFQVKDFIAQEIAKHPVTKPNNLEEKVISLIGSSLYESFIKGYTQKQWGKDPRELPVEFIRRIPVRYNYNNNYFSDPYQGMPKDGYAFLFQKILGHENIDIELNIDFYDIREMIPSDCRVFFSGPRDRYFDYKFGKLQWRSLRFEQQIIDVRDYQGTSVMNFADPEIPYTRIHEYKHLHPERDVFHIEKTVICLEYPKSYNDSDEPYYPINDHQNNDRYELYAKEVRHHPKLIFGGRLGAYRYWDMDQAIGHALTTFNNLPKGE